MNPNFRSLTREKREVQIMSHLMPATLAAMKKIAFTLLCCTLLMLVAAPAWAPSQQAFAQNKVTRGGTVTGGNGFYTVDVQDTIPGVGLYTATTGPNHPAGNMQDVLFGGGNPGTSYSTIHSFSTNTDYSVYPVGASSGTAVNIDQYGTTVPLPIGATGTAITGARTTYILPGLPATKDALTIVQDVNVNGTTFGNSTIEVTTKVTNTADGGPSVAIGVRYLWDFKVAGDDGPTFQAIPDGSVLVNETDFLAPTFQSYQMADNDDSTSPFVISGTVTGPSTVVPTPTVPSLLQYVSWPNANGQLFAYQTSPTQDIATQGGTDDSAVLYFFGDNQNNAMTIEPGATATVSASLFAIPPVAVPGLTLTPATGTDNVGQTHTVTAHPTLNISPAQGVTVFFTVSGANPSPTDPQPSCVTDTTGTCTFTYTGTNPGTDSIGASATISNQLVNATPVSETWVSPNITITHPTPPNVTTVFDYGPYNFKSTPGAKTVGNSLAITAIPVDPSAFSAVGGPFPTAQCFPYGGTSGKCVEFDVKCTGPNCNGTYDADFATSFDFTGPFVGKPGFLRVEASCSPTVFSNPTTTNQITSFAIQRQDPTTHGKSGGGSCWAVVQGLDSTIYPNTDLSILKLAPPLVVKGTKLTYGMSVFNLGPNLATGVSVTDPIPVPSSMSLVSSAVCITGTSGISCTTNNSVIPPCTVGPDPNNNNAPTVTCQVGNLLPFSLKTLATAGIALTFQLNPTLASGTIINNTARVQAFNPDPRLNNNTSTAVTKVCTNIVKGKCVQ
jgi:uncharacterized repeat protein (TIGR01451 family)